MVMFAVNASNKHTFHPESRLGCPELDSTASSSLTSSEEILFSSFNRYFDGLTFQKYFFGFLLRSTLM